MSTKGRKCPPGCPCGRHKRTKRPNERRPHTAESKRKISKALQGRELPADHGKKISKAKRKRFLELEEEMPYKLPERKRCHKCGRTRLRKFFTTRKTKLASGLVREYLLPECRDCNAERSKAWREKKKQEGTLAEIQKRYAKKSSKTPERREYQRIYQHDRRRREGRKKNRQKVTAVKTASQLAKAGEEMYPVGPIAQYLKDKNITQVPGLHRATVGKVRNELIDPVSLDTIDKILTGMEEPWMSHQLYPLEGSDTIYPE